MFTDLLPRNGRPIVVRVCLRGNVLTSNGYTRYSFQIRTVKVVHGAGSLISGGKNHRFAVSVTRDYTI
jgi:hypothetical protein